MEVSLEFVTGIKGEDAPPDRVADRNEDPYGWGGEG